MPLFALDHTISFPPVHLSEPDGLLAMGGDLSTERLLSAYAKGIFPWYEGDTPLWWCPDPRFVLFPEEVQVSKSMKVLMRRQAFTFSVDQHFEAVIRHCKKTPRKDQDGTWITDEVERAYVHLHRQGYAHSAEASIISSESHSELVGGLYGIRLGRVFFGESMFSHVTNASKYAFLSYVAQLKGQGVALIDCQVYTPFLESLGARMIPRTTFIQLLHDLI
jgi:leucyl/phenylalanyl-tRNA---protein transferase